MPWGIAAAAVVGVASQYDKNKRASQATNQQLAGIENATTEIKDATKKAEGTLQPIIDTANKQLPGVESGITQMQGQLGQGIAGLKQQQSGLNVGQFYDPSMAFQQAEGQKAIEQSAAARGGLLSGAAIKEAAKFSQGLASTNYNNAVQQALANRGQQIGIAQDQSQIGQQGMQAGSQLYQTGINARTNQSQLQAGLGENLATLQQSAGNTAAAGTASKGNPLLTGIQTGLSAYFSDERMKYGIDEISDDEIDDFLSKLNPSTYEYTDEAKSKGAPEGKQVGIIAQDAEKSDMGDELVEEDDEGDKMISIPKSVSALLAVSSNFNTRLKKLEGKK